jgi:hypothetical protein
MIAGKRVVAYTPYGREQTVSILAEYLKAEQAKGFLDEWMLCMNTDPGQEADVAYAHKLAKNHKWINCYTRPGHLTPDLPIPDEWKQGDRHPKQMNTGRFNWYMQDPDTIYVRLDDDIVWMEHDALHNLVLAKISRPDLLGVFPVIWNNAICSWWLHQEGHLQGFPPVGRHCVDPMGWGDPQFAERLHGLLLEHIAHHNERLTFIAGFLELGWREQFSVSAFAIEGDEYAQLGGVLDWDEEEHWLTQFRTGIVRKANAIVGNAAVSHFTFFTQRAYILNETDLLDRYRELSLTYPSDVPVLTRDKLGGSYYDELAAEA